MASERSCSVTNHNVWPSCYVTIPQFCHNPWYSAVAIRPT